MQTLNILSGGAAQGLVGQFKERYLRDSGLELNGTFGAVGLMKEKLLAGAPCDVLILTQALIEQLEASGHVVPGSSRALGVVKTGVAVKSGEAMPRVDTAEALKAALLAAQGIYFPDPVKATAGIHFMKVMQSLGVATVQADKLHVFPNGATAMGELSRASGHGHIGCTQVTEILYTPGVQLVGVLPPEFELATVYTAAVCQTAAHPRQAAELIALLTGDEAADARRDGGFEALR